MDTLWTELKVAAETWAESGRPLPRVPDSESAVQEIARHYGVMLPRAALKFYAREFTGMVSDLRASRAPAGR